MGTVVTAALPCRAVIQAPAFAAFDLGIQDVSAQPPVRRISDLRRQRSAAGAVHRASRQRPYRKPRGARAAGDGRKTTSPSASSWRPANNVYWKDTAIFVLEDDSQNGPDHGLAPVGAALVASRRQARKRRSRSTTSGCSAQSAHSWARATPANATAATRQRVPGAEPCCLRRCNRTWHSTRRIAPVRLARPPQC